MSKDVINPIVEHFKNNTNAKGDVIKQDVNALQGYKVLLSKDDFTKLIDTMREENLLKGSRGGSSDSQECKEIRRRYEAFLQQLKKDNLVVRDEEYYTLTKKERLVALDSNNDRIQPSLNMSNVDNKIRKAKEKEAQAIKQG